MDLLVYLVATTINVALVSFVVRRLLGVPVGWPRTILLSLLFQAGSAGLLGWVEQTLGLDMSVTSTSLAQAAAILGLVLAWLIAAQVAILAILEAFVPTGSLPGPVALLRSLPARRRRAARYTSIVRIAASHGLGAYLRPARSGPDVPASKVARSLRLALTEGGVTFVKLGQMLSSRPDLLPEPYVRELSVLQDRVPAQPWPEVERVLEAELGRPVADVFARIEHEPVAAASVGQVHRATLLSGEDVVVKVQRTGARRQTTADLDIILRLSRWLDRTTGWGRRLGVRGLAEGFAASLEEELDYRVELRNMIAVADGLAQTGSDRIRVPRAHDCLCTERVLVMSLLPGRPVSEAADVLAPLTAGDRKSMAEDLLGVVLRQVVVAGVFHADLHPGNVFVSPDGSLGLLDFGSVGRLDHGARTSIGLLLAAVDRQDSIAAADAVLDLLDRTGRVDDRNLERDLGQLMLRHASGAGVGGSAAMFVELFRVVLRHGLAVPPQVAAAFRALGALEGSLRLISPGIDVVEAARTQGRGLVQSTFTPEAVRTTLESQLATVLPLLQRLPRRVGKITEDLEAGRFTVSVRALADPGDRAFLTGIVHQLVMTLLAAASVLGGIILVASQGGPLMTGQVRLYPFLGFVLVFFGFILGCRVLALVFHQHRVTAEQG
jgi:ubiquinone biosynthesis protein